MYDIVKRVRRRESGRSHHYVLVVTDSIVVVPPLVEVELDVVEVVGDTVVPICK